MPARPRCQRPPLRRRNAVRGRINGDRVGC